MRQHPACEDCVLTNGRCLLQNTDDVESCEDVREWNLAQADEDWNSPER